MRLILLGAFLPGLAVAQATQWVEIVLEKHDKSAWRQIDPASVLERGDQIRFRFRTNYEGFFYVINSGTSGAQTLLFPRQETGRQNSVSAKTEHLVPATGAAFQIAGPPGQDIVYWVLSPVALEGDSDSLLRSGGLPDAARHPPPRLIPRCDGTILKARGDCIDSTAGPRSTMSSRDLVIVQDHEVTRISSPKSLTEPAVYEFRIAHN